MARQGLNVSTNVPVAADKITADNLLEQIIKVDVGAEGVADPLTAGQKTKANSVPVTLASDQGPIDTKDAGPAQNLTRTYTESANMTTAAAITAAPNAGEKVVLMDVLVSADTAMNFSLQMETSNNVLAKVFLPANGVAQITLRGFVKGDAADKRIFGKASVAGNVAITAVQFSEA